MDRANDFEFSALMNDTRLVLEKLKHEETLTDSEKQILTRVGEIFTHIDNEYSRGRKGNFPPTRATNIRPDFYEALIRLFPDNSKRDFLDRLYDTLLSGGVQTLTTSGYDRAISLVTYLEEVTFGRLEKEQMSAKEDD